MPISEMLLELHNGEWSKTQELLLYYRDRPFFPDAIAVYRKKTK